MRPASIITFDRLYLVSIGLGLVNSFLGIDHTRAILAADQRVQSLNMVEPMVYGSLALSIAIPLMFWYLVAYKASVLAKWVLVIFTAGAVANFVMAQIGVGSVTGLGILMTLAIEVLRVVALSFLFRADAKAWLGQPAAGANADG